MCRIPQFWKITTGGQQWACSERPGCSPTCLLRTGQSDAETTLSIASKTLIVTHVSVLKKRILADLLILMFSWPLSLNMESELGSLILATDISRQNEYLSRFRMHLDQENLCLSNGSHRHFILQVG